MTEREPTHLAADDEVLDLRPTGPWVVHFVWKLLHNDARARSLLARDPFPGMPPRFIRVELYRYAFAPLGDSAVWRRTRLGAWLPPLSTETPELRRFLTAYGWLPGN